MRWVPTDGWRPGNPPLHHHNAAIGLHARISPGGEGLGDDGPSDRDWTRAS